MATISSHSNCCVNNRITMEYVIVSFIGLLTVIHQSHAMRSGDIPRFIQEPKSGVIKSHTPVTLHCLTSPKALETKWKFNGEQLTNDPDKGTEIRSNGDLHITSFKHKPKNEAHTGIYQCVSVTTLGVLVSREVTLDRAVIHNFNEEEDLDVSATEGNVALIPCSPPGGHPSVEVLFEVNGSTIDQASDRHKILPSGNLQIAKVRQSDSGSYRCIAVNPVTGQKKIAGHVVRLKVIAPVVNVGARIMMAPPKNIEVVLGEKLTLECVITGSPVPWIGWTKYGGTLPEGRYTQQLGNLIISNVTHQDQGTYICRGENGDRRSSVNAVSFVEVLQPPRIRVAKQLQIVTEGSTVAFQCLMRGNPLPKGEWFHNGMTVLRNEFISITDTSLSITNVQEQHSGLYQCVARNKVDMMHAEMYLDVRKPGEDISVETDENEMQDIAPDSILHDPAFSTVPSNTTVYIGSTILLECSVANPQTTELHWLRDGQPFAYISFASDEPLPGDEYDEEEYQDGSSVHNRHKVAPTGALQIFNARLTDAAKYTCVASNTHGRLSVDAYLEVKDLEGVDTQESENAQKGITNRPPVDILFTTNPTLNLSLPNGGFDLLHGEDISPGSQERGRNRGGRRRNKNRNTGRRDEYDYLDEDLDDLDYTNPVDTDGSMLPPSRPIVEKLSDSSVKVSWTVAQGGLPITFFKVQYRELTTDRRRRGWKTIDEDISPRINSYEVAGLTPGSTYRFRVMAVYSNNDNMQSPNSARFTLEVAPALRPLAPGQGPVIAEARSLSSTRIQITWQYLPVKQAPIEGFYVYYKPYSSSGKYKKEPLLGSRQRQHLITGLRPDTEYSIKIRCFNTAGESDDSNTVVKRTLGDSDFDPSVFAPLDHEHSDHHPEYPGDLHPDEHGDHVEYHDDDEYPSTRLSTKNSSEMLYMILGIVLGVMMLLLIIFMIMCGWKQRQQRRMMAAMHANMRKFQDPSKVIYDDSLRKKTHLINGSPFMLNGLTIPNGHANGHTPVSNGHGPVHYTANGGSRVNLNINPLGEVEDDKNNESLTELRTSLQGMLPPPPSIPPPSLPDHNTLNSSHYSDRSVPVMNNLHGPCDAACCNDNLYNSLRRAPPGYRTSHDYLPPSQRGFDSLRRSHDQVSASDQSQTSSGRNRRRRKRPKDALRDHCTNTDYSSNEGTLDDRRPARPRTSPHARGISHSPSSPPPGYSASPFLHHETPYMNTMELGEADGPPRVPSPPTSYGIAHSYGQTANTSFGRRPSPPDPELTPFTRDLPPVPAQLGVSSPMLPKNSQSLPHHDSLANRRREYNSSPLHESESPLLNSSPCSDADRQNYNSNVAPPVHGYNPQGLILPLSDRDHSPLPPHDEGQYSPHDSISEASHIGRYSPSQNHSSPASTEARSSPVSHDQYSESHDPYSESHDSSDNELDEELPIINPYAILDMDPRHGGLPTYGDPSVAMPYNISDIPRATDYPPSEHSS